MRKFVLAGISGIAALALGMPSLAAPDRAVSLSRVERTAAWSSDLGVSPYVGLPAAYSPVRCAEAVHACDDTLIRLIDPGTLSVDVVAEAPAAYPPLMSIELYRSDAQGTRGQRVRVTKRTGGNAESFTTARTAAGYYLVEVEWTQGAGSYDAVARFAP